MRLVLVAALAGWVLTLRPVSLGGPAGYIVVAGHSMHPTLEADTLVWTMQARSYELGDVVAFHLPDVNATAPLVIHRIVGGSAQGGFRTQGDNVALPDPWLVRPEQILGREVAAIPGVGRAVAMVRAPIVLASVAAGIGTYLLLGWLPGRREEHAEPSTEESAG